MTESALALQFSHQHALTILDDCLAVGTLLQVLANLRHHVGVKRLQQHLVAPTLFTVLKILKHEGQFLPFAPLTGATTYGQHSLNSSFKFHTIYYFVVVLLVQPNLVCSLRVLILSASSLIHQWEQQYDFFTILLFCRVARTRPSGTFRVVRQLILARSTTLLNHRPLRVAHELIELPATILNYYITHNSKILNFHRRLRFRRNHLSSRHQHRPSQTQRPVVISICHHHVGDALIIVNIT